MKYSFTKIDENITIVPMGTLFCKRIMDRIKKRCQGVILPNLCFFNAIVIAAWLEEYGFDVEVVEGVYAGNEYGYQMMKKMYKVKGLGEPEYSYVPESHRWLKKGDKYFDPTIELLMGFEFTKTFNYTAKRIFDYKTLIEYAIEIKNTLGYKAHFVNTTDGITQYYDGDIDVPVEWGYINGDGVYIPPKRNPYEVFPELKQSSYPINF